MFLAIDIGNTCISTGLFENGKIKHQAKMEHSKNTNTHTYSAFLKSAFGNVDIDTCIISSVANELTDAVKNAVLETYKLNAKILTNDYDTGIKLKVDKPETIGTDRLANICSASALYSNRPLIVIDSGTATTFDIVDKENNFIGGVIMPGFGMQLKSLHNNTSKLPEIKFDKQTAIYKVIGTNTESQILSGVIVGHISSIEGLLDKCKEELGEKSFVVITGGGADIIKNHMPENKYNAVDNALTLKGLYHIYQRNKSSI